MFKKSTLEYLAHLVHTCPVKNPNPNHEYSDYIQSFFLPDGQRQKINDKNIVNISCKNGLNFHWVDPFLSNSSKCYWSWNRSDQLYQNRAKTACNQFQRQKTNKYAHKPINSINMWKRWIYSPRITVVSKLR